MKMTDSDKYEETREIMEVMSGEGLAPSVGIQILELGSYSL